MAYNPTADEYLVSWWGDDDAGGLVDEEYEIYVQRLSADGTEIGGDTQIPNMGPTGYRLQRVVPGGRLQRDGQRVPGELARRR